jgi:ferritin-like metal-binding protein YciE
MKPLFNTLNEALTYHLEGLHDAEKKLQIAIPNLMTHANSTALKEVLENYATSAGENRIKLKRAFSYLLAGPFGKESKAIGEMMAELSMISRKTSAPEIKDALLGSCLSTIIYYKISAYSSAMSFALALELHPVADLISEMLECEGSTNQALTKIMGKLSNRAAKETASTVKQ